jgi:hypothetical protein
MTMHIHLGKLALAISAAKPMRLDLAQAVAFAVEPACPDKHVQVYMHMHVRVHMDVQLELPA